MVMCGCEISAFRKLNNNTCSVCGFVFCDLHIYTYVDGNNGAITKNAKKYCKKCFLKKHKSL